ncbi:MAG TPA: RodZ domain-containing protein [Candidatus Limnocylindria bacterium]|nr:RodZ domain-containing protein [Candidatus Limnocylindria bacterium]
MTDQELHKLGEVLRTAREAKGVDLARVERDTKIRARYLTALETGDYAELPGAVYTKGFLRNYGSYLGLDVDYLIDLYRLESTQPSERATLPAPPRPIATRRRRTFVVTPGAILAAVLTVGVAAFIIYLVQEFVTFARTPDLVITDPAGDIAGYAGTEYRIVGVTEPNSRVTVDGLRENPTVTADASGNFTINVALVPGSNVITLVANDPLTGRDSQAVHRTIVVGGPHASGSPGVAPFAIISPGEGATVDGNLRLEGTAPVGGRVTVSASLVDRAPVTIRITSLAGDDVRVPGSTPDPPDPVTLTADANGAYAGRIGLSPGTWRLTFEIESGGSPATRTVTVEPPGGLQGVLRVRGGTSYLEIDEDGQPKPRVSGRNANAGTRIELDARRELRIRVGNAGAVHLVINGIDLGPMGGSGAVAEWRITRR